MSFGTTPISTTTLGTNQFPVSAVYVQGASGGNFTALQGGPVSSADINGNVSAPVAIYEPDGNNVALGTTTDASTANTLIGLTKAIKANTASITIGSGVVTANQGGTWTITANIGTTNGLALDTSVNGLLVSQGSSTSGEKGPLVQGAVTTSAPTYTTGQTSPISLTPSGAIRVDASATVQPVSGTFWQTTQPISAASLPLPGGAATSAKQPALGSAGSASTDVLTVQGIASMTPLKVDGSGVTQPISGTITATQATGSNLHTVVDSGAITATTNADTSIGGTSAPSKGLLLIGKSNDGTPQYQPLPEGPGGRSIIVEGNASGTALPVSGTFWPATQPVSGTVTANAGTGTFTNQQSNVQTDYDTSAGTQNVTLFGVALPASGGAVAGGTPSNPLRTDPTGTTTQPISAASLPLPTGAATSAKQPALGTAGSASSDVLTVQGIASMTALKVDGSGVTQPVSGTITANAGSGTFNIQSNASVNVNQIAGSSVATAATGIQKVGLTDGSGNSITSTTNALDVNIKSGGGSGFSVTDEAAWTAGTSAFVPAGGVFNDTAAALTSGQEGAIRLTNNRAIHSNIRNSSGTELATNSNPLRVDPTGTTTQPISGTVTANQGGTWTVQPGNTANTTPWLATLNQGGNSATVTASNALKVDGSAVTQPISGTITANAGSGTFNDQHSNNTTDYDTGAGTQTMTMFGLALPASGGAVAGGTSSNPIRTDPTGTTTQPISGTVTANAGTGTFNIQSNASVNVSQIAGSSVATAATGIQKVGLTDGTGNAITSTSNAIDVNIKSGGGSGFSITDEAAWTAGTSAFVPAGGVFNDSAAALTSGQQGSARLTNNRAIHVNLRDASANQLLGSKTSANSLPVVIASDQGAVTVSGTVTANAGTGTFTNQQTNNTADYDTSAGTQTMTMFGLALPASGGAVAGGTSSNPIKIDPTGTTTQPVSGTVTANAGSGSFTVAQATGSNLHAVLDSGSTTAVTQATASSLNAQVVGSVASAGSNAGNPVKVGGAFNSTQPTVTTGQIVDAQMTARGAQIVATGVDAFAVNASQSGTWNITNVSGTVSLPTGAATSAKQPALGTAGSASTDVITVQGIASMTALKVDGSAVTQPVSGTVTANAGTGTFNNQQSNNTTDYDTGAGTQTMTMFGMALPASGGAVAGGTNTNPIRIDPTGTTTQPVSGTVTANAGTGSFTVAQATGSNLHALLDSGSTTAVTQATASNLNAQVVGAAASGGSNSGNPVKIGGAFNTTQPTVTTGQAVDAQMTARGAQIVATGVDTFSVSAAQSGTWNIANVSGTVSLPTGAATSAKQPALGTAGSASSDVLTVQGIASMTALKVDGSAVTQPISGTITANIGTSGSLALDATVAKLNVAQAAALGSNTGPMMQGSVTTNAPSYTTGNINPLSLDTSGLLRASLKDTPSNTNNLNVNLAASAATVTVTASNLQTNLNQIAGSSVSTAATGVQKVGIVGNTGATVDSTVAAGTAPTNAVTTGAVYNSSAPAPTNGQAMAVQADQAGNVRMFPGIALTTLSAWNSSTSLNATQTIFSNSGAESVLIQLDQTSTITAGAVTFEATFDGTNWISVPANCLVDPTSTTYTQISNPYTLQASTNKPFVICNNGWQGLRIRLSTQITGTGAVTPYYNLLPFDTLPSVIALSPTAANFNVTAIPQVGTTGGATPSHTVSAASTNATSTKSSAGSLYGFCISNTNASARFFKLYDKNAAPTVGTDTPVLTIQVPGSSTVARAYPVGLKFSNGIAWATTTGIANSDTGAVGASDLSIDLDYN